MARVFWDSNLFIYLFEQNPTWGARVLTFRESIIVRGDRLMTSWLTVGEVLTKPRQSGNAMLEKSYLNFFESGAVQVVAFDEHAARSYAQIRSRTRIRPPDAIQLACAASAGTDPFVTSDDRLSRFAIPGVTFVTSLSKIPY